MSGKRPPRIPTWLLATCVLGALATSALLFLTPHDEPRKHKPTKSEHRDSDSTLELPGDDGTDTTADDDRQRHDQTTETTGESAGDSAIAESELPPNHANLRGARIALGPMSATSVTAADASVKFGDMRAACGSPQQPEALARELAVLDRMQALLEASGATVTRLDTPAHAVRCVDDRARALNDSDMFLVVDAAGITGEDAPAKVLLARNVGTATKDEATRAGRLVGELAAALGLDAVTANTSPAAKALLARGAVLHAPRGGVGALVQLPPLPTDDSQEAAPIDELARTLVGALASAHSTGS